MVSPNIKYGQTDIVLDCVTVWVLRALLVPTQMLLKLYFKFIILYEQKLCVRRYYVAVKVPKNSHKPV